MCHGELRSLFTIGASGTGKSLFLSALVAEAEEARIRPHIVSPSINPQRVLRDLGQGNVQLLAVDRFDQLSQGVRTSIVENRNAAALGLFATAEQIGAATESVLEPPSDVVFPVSQLEGRPDDVVAIAQLLWPDACGFESDLMSHCTPGAIESLCGGPHVDGVTSLRETLSNLANALITSGALSEMRFLRRVESQDIDAALLTVMRSRPLAPSLITNSAVIIVEGTTDVLYLTAASRLATAAWGWDLLNGCELRAAGDERAGGAVAVWLRLLELRAASIDSVGLLDNDRSGRHASRQAGGQTLPVELLPKDFDRLRLDDEELTVEIEDLLSVTVLDAYYALHPESTPEEVRWRDGAWRIVPRGVDKDAVTRWIIGQMTVDDCERLIYLLCVLRRRLGMPIPRDDLDSWRRDLLRVRDPSPQATIAMVGNANPGE